MQIIQFVQATTFVKTLKRIFLTFKILKLDQNKQTFVKIA